MQSTCPGRQLRVQQKASALFLLLLLSKRNCTSGRVITNINSMTLLSPITKRDKQRPLTVGQFLCATLSADDAFFPTTFLIKLNPFMSPSKKLSPFTLCQITLRLLRLCPIVFIHSTMSFYSFYAIKFKNCKFKNETPTKLS